MADQRTKAQLFSAGKELIVKWCQLNSVTPPEVLIDEQVTQFDTCAYYRDSIIHIWVPACAAIGTAGRAWSYPGYIVDRTPYGVLAHELGHHVDDPYTVSQGRFSHDCFMSTREAPVTSYAATNVAEWFAEAFRIYVTNPQLLQALRPKTWAFMVARWPRIAEQRAWEQVLSNSARDHVKAAQNRITKDARKSYAHARLF